jgi:hypothetical protein
MSKYEQGVTRQTTYIPVISVVESTGRTEQASSIAKDIGFSLKKERSSTNRLTPPKKNNSHGAFGRFLFFCLYIFYI